MVAVFAVQAAIDRESGDRRTRYQPGRKVVSRLRFSRSASAFARGGVAQFREEQVSRLHPQLPQQHAAEIFLPIPREVPMHDIWFGERKMPERRNLLFSISRWWLIGAMAATRAR